MNVSRNSRRKPLKLRNPLSESYIQHREQVSLGKLYALLDIEPTPLQDAMIELFDNKIDEWSELNIAASRRFGKTFSQAVLIVRELLIINSSTMVVSKSSKSVGVLFNEVLRLLRVLGVKPTKINSNNHTLQLNDSIFRATPVKTMDTLLGQKMSLGIIDEAGVFPYTEDYDITMKPMRLDFGSNEDTKRFNAKIVRVSSPRSIGSNFYYDIIKGYVSKPKALGLKDIYISPEGVCSLTYSIHDSPLITPNLIEAIKASTDKDTYATEYLAKFIHMGAASAFSQFNKEHNLFTVPELLKNIGGGPISKLGFNISAISEGSPRLQGFVGLDIGWRDSSAIIIGTVIDNKIYIVDAFASPYLTTKEFAEQIHEMLTKWQTHELSLDFGEGAIYIDKTAAMTTADLNTTYDIPAMPGFNKVREGVSLINEGFRANNLYINEDLTDLIDEIDTLAFKENIIGGLNKTQGDPFIRPSQGHHDRVHAMRYLVTSIMMYWGIANQSTELDYS